MALTVSVLLNTYRLACYSGVYFSFKLYNMMVNVIRVQSPLSSIHGNVSELAKEQSDSPVYQKTAKQIDKIFF